MYEPVSRLDPVLVDHEVNVRGTIVVEARVDRGHLHHTIRVSVPATA